MPDYQVKNVEPVAVGTDIQVRVFTLADGDAIPWHYHRQSTDHYFVLLQIELEREVPESMKPRKIEVQLGKGQLSGDKSKTIEHSKVA